MNVNNVDGTCHERDYLLKQERKQRLQLLWVSEFMKNFMKQGGSSHPLLKSWVLLYNFHNPSGIDEDCAQPRASVSAERKIYSY